MQLPTLIKVASWGALISFGGAAGLYYVTQAGINRSPFYALAVEEARRSKAAMRALGGELHPHSVQLFSAGRRIRVLEDTAEVGAGARTRAKGAWRSGRVAYGQEGRGRAARCPSRVIVRLEAHAPPFPLDCHSRHWRQGRGWAAYCCGFAD